MSAAPDPASAAPRSPVVGPSKPRLWQVLGPGLITGAADDDPSGIATYSQAGAQFGFQLAWTLVLTYPLMVVIQAICARIGRTTGKGIAGNLRTHYPSWLFQSVVALLFVANTLNISADLGAMGEAMGLLAPRAPAWVYVAGFGAVCGAAQIVLEYTRYVALLKWLTLSLFAYFAALMAILVTAAATLHGAGRTSIDSAAQAAEALRPIAGNLAFAVFALGIIGTGLLSIPVLAGSAAYAVGEAEGWSVGLAKRPLQAKAFYGAIIAATLLGAVGNLFGVNPIHALVWSAVINGIVAVPVMALVMLMSTNRSVLGEFTVSRWWVVIGWSATGLMAVATLSFLVTSWQGLA